MPRSLLQWQHKAAAFHALCSGGNLVVQHPVNLDPAELLQIARRSLAQKNTVVIVAHVSSAIRLAVLLPCSTTLLLLRWIWRRLLKVILGWRAGLLLRLRGLLAHAVLYSVYGACSSVAVLRLKLLGCSVRRNAILAIHAIVILVSGGGGCSSTGWHWFLFDLGVLLLLDVANI